MTGHGPESSGLVEKGITHRLDSMALEDFSNLSESVFFILFFLNNVPYFFFLHDSSVVIQTFKNSFAFLPQHKDTKFISTIIII